MDKRPLALITGAGRTIGIGNAIAKSLAESGWDIAITYWNPYDASMTWGSNPEETRTLVKDLESRGASVQAVEADLSLTETPEDLFNIVNDTMGLVSALILSHCHSVDSDILTTTVASFDRHYAVNTRATWLLVREFASRFSGNSGTGRIISLTSDHTAGNLPYGSSKGAMDRIVLAAAKEFRAMGITANVINPGAVDTGWMTEELIGEIGKMTLSERIGQPQDCANLVKFLCSEEGRWINGQLLCSNGGIA